MNADKIDFNYSHVSVLWCGKLVDGVEHDVVVEIAPDGMVTLVIVMPLDLEADMVLLLGANKMITLYIMNEIKKNR